MPRAGPEGCCEKRIPGPLQQIGSFAKLTAIRRASSLVSSLAAERGRACLRMIAELAHHRQRYR
jgi:hypothetical protein